MTKITIKVYLKNFLNFFSGTVCFFIRAFYNGLCVMNTDQIQSTGSWGKLLSLRFSENCLDPSNQFRFRDNGAILNLKSQGCLAAFNKNDSGSNLDMLYLYVDSVSLDTNACAQKPNESIYRAVTQSPGGGLSVYYKGKNRSRFETWRITANFSIKFHSFYVGLARPGIGIRLHDQTFYFG